MWRRFRESRKGSIGPAAAVIMPVLALSVAITLETADQSRIKGMMQASLDGALLAVSAKAKAMSGRTPVFFMMPFLKAAFIQDYSANFSQVMYGNSDFTLNEEDLTLTYDAATKTASAQVSFSNPATFALILNKTSFDFKVEGKTKLDTDKRYFVIDIVMCIDATGSMQNTLDGVTKSAGTFNTDLRDAIGLPPGDETVKVRVRPIFYRDTWDTQRVQYWWYRPSLYYNYYTNYLVPTTRDPKFYPAFLARPDFIDLNPNPSTRLNSVTQNTELAHYLGSQRAAGGGDGPELAEPCLNEGIRADWYKVDSAESREFFNIPASTAIRQLGEEPPASGDVAYVSVVPVIAFWTDATMQPLTSASNDVSATTPRTWSDFEALWMDPAVINQKRKILISFGRNTGTGWDTVTRWDHYAYGGSLAEGNTQAAKIIAEEIKRVAPEVIRISN
ncbi:hypothetical protein CSC94_06300 [Zhengella mangrovi]|uniref:Uncharacterized protein n=1 Tax=Zhengella mangrovi TaxID=1982044 RepID=A0A2G1QSS7_9HYPH|nr:hypothetical protein [Zhengella mangrovi]PHP68258.1 hypothetical protein CSC94_06300 [Zhengella mangrovi]